MPIWITLLQLVYSAVSPALKAMAVAELKVLDAQEKNPFIKFAIEEAEKLLS